MDLENVAFPELADVPKVVENNSSSDSKVYCLQEDEVRIMKILLGEESGAFQSLLANNSCNGSDALGFTSSPLNLLSHTQKSDLQILYRGFMFYAYVTPFMILLGIIGNGLSLRVFTTRRMRKVSASWYLAALALSDSLVLIIYVLIGWLFQGMPKWPGSLRLNLLIYPGICESYLYLSYMFRFTSAWLIVIFTVERYIGVCRPLYRRALCTESFAKKALLGIVFSAMIISLYKPILCGVQQTAYFKICTRKEGYEVLNFSMDAVYGLTITAVPFTIIACLNLLIVRTLKQSHKRQKQLRTRSEEGGLRLEFTIALLVISSSFILFNLPYFVLWCYNFQTNLYQTISVGNPTQSERTRGWLFITRTIFFTNYCVNFFLYSLTGGYFRRQLKALLSCDAACIKDQDRAYNAMTCSQTRTGSTTLPRSSASARHLSTRSHKAVEMTNM